MSFLKKIIKKAFSPLGYGLIRLSEPQVNIANFVNLSQAYERLLNEKNNLIIANDTRPKLLARLLGTPPSKAYFIVQALAQCIKINGDVCEFGVAQGETSALIANEMSLYSKKTLHLFDSFEGLPKPSENDKLKDDVFLLGNIEAYTGAMSFPEKMVRARLKAISFPIDQYVIHKGFIEQLIKEDKNLPEKVSFAYIDFDFYEPIKVALQFLNTVTSNGAIIIVDDYNFFSTGSKTAVDEFISGKNLNEMVYDCFVPSTIYGHFAVLTKK